MIMSRIIRIASILPRALTTISRRYELLRARRTGMTVGENTRFVGNQYFGSEPYLISIGRDCLITNGVNFITHDGGIQVPFIRDGMEVSAIYGRKSIFGTIRIGDNCFIGVGAIILPDTEVCANSIIGAGSVVRGRFEEGSVIAGNPGRAVSTVSRYFEKNRPNVIEFNGNETPSARASIILNHMQ